MFKSSVLRIVSWIVLIAFVNLTLQPLEAVAKTSTNKHHQPAFDGVDERYGKELTVIREVLDLAVSKSSRGEKIDDEVSSMLSMRKSLEVMEADMKAEFKQTESHLKKYNLAPEILKRHLRAVKEFEHRHFELKQLLKSLEKKEKTGSEAALRSDMQKLAEFMKRNQHKRPHTPIDPQRSLWPQPNDNRFRL